MTDPKFIPGGPAERAAAAISGEEVQTIPAPVAAPESAMIAACNPIPADLESWADAPFPVLTRTGNHPVILLGVAGRDDSRRVFGIGFWGETPETAWSIDSHVWQPDGGFGSQRGQHTAMDLEVPPAMIGREVERLREAMAEIRQRLAAHPDAPEAWRKGDEQRLGILQRKLDKLVPPAPEAAADAR